VPEDLDSWWSRITTSIAASRLFLWISPAVVPHIDRFIHRITGGRVMISGGILPSLMLTSVGAKSGLSRTTPLAAKPEGDHWYVVGSNFAREAHPAWSANLIANPNAEISFNGSDVAVVAHLLTPEEKADVWPRIVRFWPNYEVYAERSGRDLRVFRLDPR